MSIGTAVEPALCSCGCGEATNAVVIEAQRLHDENGESWASASAKLGVSYAYIKTIRKNPPKQKRGHNRLPTSPARTCEFCGKTFYSANPSRRCSGRDCMIAGWKQQLRDAKKRREASVERWRAQRAVRRERHLLAAWQRAARQLPLSLDVPNLNRKDGSEFGSRVDWIGDHWDDPVFDEVATTPEVGPTQFLALARQATFIPEDFYRRCHDGEMCLVVDDRGVRFLILRDRRREIIPRFDPGVAIPAQASGSSGKKSSRHRGRHARSASARGKRSSRSQPKAFR